MKKHLIVVLLITAALCLCSCSMVRLLPTPTVQRIEETVSPYLEIVPDTLTYSEGYEPASSLYSYEALPLEGEKQLYQRLMDVAYDISPDKSEETERYAMPQIRLENYSLTEAQVRTAVKAVTDDHPEIFWMTGTIGYYSDDDETIIQVHSSCSPEEVDERLNAVRAVANEFYATVPDSLSEVDRELLVHDYLIERIDYDKDVDTINFDNNNPDIYTVYGALVNRVAVCEGYSRAFKMLLNGIGVDCVTVIGQSENQMHMWNTVRLEDSWYQTDVTWDDQEETYARYIYFNVTDEFLLGDHSFAPRFSEMTDEEINGETGEYNASVMNLFVPVCTDGTMGYYYLKSPHLDDFEAEELKSRLLASAENREEYFVFYIDEEMDYNSTVALLFVDYPQYFFDYLKAVDNSLYDFGVDSSNTSYYTHEKSRIVAVELHYY